MADYGLSAYDALRELNLRYSGVPQYATFWTKIKTGLVPAQKLGNSWRVDPADLPRIAEILKLTPRATDKAA